MESLVLQTLGFRLLKPNAYTMLCLLRQALDLGKRDTALAMYLVVCSQNLLDSFITALPPKLCKITSPSPALKFHSELMHLNPLNGLAAGAFNSGLQDAQVPALSHCCSCHLNNTGILLLKDHCKQRLLG